jgi:radical SAM protein with 4Fe4S-binding SPASM domain
MTHLNAQELLENYLVKRIDASVTYPNLSIFPKFIEIETVNVCNARCPMCTISDWQVDSPTMSDSLFEKIALDLINNHEKLRRVSLYRDGEPLIDKKMAQRVRRLKEGGVPEVAISTNVALLNEQKATDLLESGIDLVILSIDSLKKEIYEAIRVRLNFEEVIENAMRFIKLRDLGNYKTRIWARMIRQESNAAEWPEYQEFWRRRLQSADRVYYHNIFNWGGQLKDFQAIAPSYEPGLPCVALWSLLVVTVTGQVPMCNVDYNTKYLMGDLSVESIADVWNSKRFVSMRNAHLRNQKSENPLCANCNVWEAHESDDFFVLSQELSKAFS